MEANFLQISILALLLVSCSINEKFLSNHSSLSDKDALRIVKKFSLNGSNFYESLNCSNYDNKNRLSYSDEKEREGQKCIKFIECNNLIIKYDNNQIGSRSWSFPSEYFEYKDKLFLIYDSLVPLSEQVLEKLRNKDLIIDYDENNLLSKDYLFEINEKTKSKRFYIDQPPLRKD